MDEVWENFIRSLNPVALERERLGSVGNDERPGSEAHNAMLVLHGLNRAKFAREQKRQDLILRSQPATRFFATRQIIQEKRKAA